MTDKEFEMLYKNSPDLTPPSELKVDILLRMREEMDKKQERKKVRSFATITKRLMPIAACFVFVFILIGGFFGLENEDYQTVYIDVNPSVALHINRFGKVSGVEYINEDANAALGSVNLKGLAAADALEKMIDAYDNAGYFENGAEIYDSRFLPKRIFYDTGCFMHQRVRKILLCNHPPRCCFGSFLSNRSVHKKVSITFSTNTL